MSKKTISILGSTGSIGTQTLDVISQYPDKFGINFLSTNSKIDLLYKQIKQFNPKTVVICNEKSYVDFQSKYSVNCEVLCGRDELLELAKQKCDLLISSLVGFAGVEPTLNAINEGIDVALANKETLVSAGKIITEAAQKSGSKILAIDSEHSAILQCLIGENSEDIDKIILTASGGPFRTWSQDKFDNIKIKDALNHPNWSMGSKITIDSATMMNKGLEIIEAFWLFDITASQIDVVVHPESIIHSMVEFKDKSVKAQLGLPDMRVPISYTLFYPNRLKLNSESLNLTALSQLNFEEPNFDKFKCLELAFNTLKHDPQKCVVLNAANEISVESFLNSEISFNQIAYFVERSLSDIKDIQTSSIEEIIDADIKTRLITKELIKNA